MDEKDKKINDLCRRLKKCVSVAEKFKKRLTVQEEVIKELAYRNEQLKLEMSATVATNKTLNELLRDLDTKIKKAVDCGKAILNANSKDAQIAEFSSILLSVNEMLENRFHNQNEPRKSTLVLSPSHRHEETAGSRKTKNKWAPSIYISSESFGTSLLRRTSDSMEIKDLLSLEDPQELSNEERLDGPYHSPKAKAEPIETFDHHKKRDVIPVTGVNDLVDMPIDSLAPLFEHFIVVGASSDIAQAAAEAARLKAAEDSSLSHRLIRRIGGLLSTASSRQSSLSGLPAPIRPKQSDLTSSVHSSTHHIDYHAQPIKPLSRMSSALGTALATTASSVTNAVSLTSNTSSISPAKKSRDSRSGVNIKLPLFATNSTNLSVSSEDSHELEHESLDVTTHQSPRYPDKDLDDNMTRSRASSTADSLSTRMNESFTSMLSSSKNIFKTSLANKSTSPTGNQATSFLDQQELTDTTSMTLSLPLPNDSDDNNNDDETPAQISPLSENSVNLNQPLEQNGQSSLILDSSGSINTAATILFRFPETVEPPPPEIADFCLPLGGHLRKVNINVKSPNEDEVKMSDAYMALQEVLYGHSQSKRNGRCFVFTLDDKLGNSDNRDEEIGAVGGRLYGICVMHSRLLLCENLSTGDAETDESNDLAVHPIEFESVVCYAFITRFPLFDFFFQVIFDIITMERLQRMERLASLERAGSEKMTAGSSTGWLKDRQLYEYLPKVLLLDVLHRLTSLSPPRYFEPISFQVSPNVVQISKIRAPPPSHLTEYFNNAAEWSLPTLLSWMPVELLVWGLGLLLCESKMIIIGNEPGLVSCCVLGLLSLLQPLEWVSPIIPMLPYKHIDFIESPVPILAGLVVDYQGQGLEEAAKIIHRCNDGENGGITAVVDIYRREVCLSGFHWRIRKELILPGAKALTDKIAESLRNEGDKNHVNANDGSITNQNFTLKHGHQRERALYAVSSWQAAEVRAVQQLLTDHLSAMIVMAKDVRDRMTDKTDLVDEKNPSSEPIDSHNVAEQFPAIPEMVFFASDDESEGYDENIESSDDSSDDAARERNRHQLNLLKEFYSQGNAKLDAQSTNNSKSENDPFFSRTLLSAYKTTSAPLKSMGSLNPTASSGIGGILSSFMTSTNNTNNDSKFISSTSEMKEIDQQEDDSPQLTNGLILLSQESLDGDSDKFFHRLIRTQLYSEYIDGL